MTAHALVIAQVCPQNQIRSVTGTDNETPCSYDCSTKLITLSDQCAKGGDFRFHGLVKVTLCCIIVEVDLIVVKFFLKKTSFFYEVVGGHCNSRDKYLRCSVSCTPNLQKYFLHVHHVLTLLCGRGIR
jgi:hypothetical protein